MGIVFASLFLPLDGAMTERSSLLQQHHGELIRAASAGHVSISDVKKVQVQMLEELKQNGHKMSPADIEQFDLLFKSYGQHFSQQLQDDHDVDDKLWTKELAKDAKCYSFTEQRFSSGGDVHYREQDLLIWHNKSKACSKASKSWQIYSEAASTCMVSSSGLGHLHEVDGHADLFMTMGTMKTDISLYHAMAPNTSGLPTSCDADLVQLEDKSCSLATSKLAACQAEGQCIGTVDLLSTKQEIEERSEQRREAKYEMNKMTCKLNKMFEALKKNMTGDMNVTEMGSICDDEKLGPADLKLTLVASSSTWCSDTTWGKQPSSQASSCQDWLDATYYLWPSASHVVPTVCQTSCEQPPSPDPPPPQPAGCVDTNASGCEIFKHHFDACATSHYKTDTFDPEDACCACGGGTAASVKYTHYPNTNAYVLHCGAESNLQDDGGLIGYTLEMCAARCDADPECNCFVIQDTGIVTGDHCYKRRNCVPGAMCAASSVYNTYLK